MNKRWVLILGLLVVVLLGAYWWQRQSGAVLQPVAPIALGTADSGKMVTVKQGDRLTVTLRNPGDGGYVFTDPDFTATVLKVESHVHTLPTDTKAVGNFGTDTWVFQALSLGETTIAFHIKRSWESERIPTATFRVLVTE